MKLGLEEPRAIQVHPYKGWLFYMCCLVSGVGEAGSGGASSDTGSPVQRVGCCTCVVWFQGLVKLGLEEPRAIQVHPYKGLIVVHVLSGFRCW